MKLELGKIVCQGTYQKPDANNCCPSCGHNASVFVSQSNGGRIMAHTRS